jgi:two-component sensor histidine kinase/PAS domain-containing protein
VGCGIGCEFCGISRAHYAKDVVTASNSIFSHTTLSEPDRAWLYQVASEGQLLADLSFADIVLWAPTETDGFVAVAHLRPSSSATLFYRDLVGKKVRREWLGLIEKAYTLGEILDSSAPDWFESTPTRLRAIPVRNRPQASTSPERETPIAVMTRHSNLSETRMPSRLELTYNECANDVFHMISEGTFPDPDTPSAPPRGAPRASDGLIRLDVEGRVTFASPNALSAFVRMGFDGELEGKLLPQVTTELLSGTLIVDESLPLVVSGRAPWRTDLDSQGVTVTLRAIPLKSGGVRQGAIVLCRDVTQVRRQERELITKDATIREIHHRVKNNLQTVASLLRIQSRRTHSDVAKEALGQAMRRVAAIAVVHDTLSEGLSQNVDFDVVFDRVLMLVTEVASAGNQVIKPRTEGSFGILPSAYATPLALVLTELVTNAVEHGLAGHEKGDVVITTTRTPEWLTVIVRDNGRGLPEGRLGDGLGTQIVKTLVQGELGGHIDWRTVEGQGTEVVITIPMQYVEMAPMTAAIPIV